MSKYKIPELVKDMKVMRKVYLDDLPKRKERTGSALEELQRIRSNVTSSSEKMRSCCKRKIEELTPLARNEKIEKLKDGKI